MAFASHGTALASFMEKATARGKELEGAAAAG